MHQFMILLRSPLLLPVMILLLTAGVIQVLLNAWLIREQAGEMNTEVRQHLDAAFEGQARAMETMRQQLLESLQTMQNESSSQMGEQLALQLARQGERIGENRRELLVGNTELLAKVVGELAVPYIWDQDTPKLTEMAQLIDDRPGVVFAVFFDQYEKRMTRSIDRKDPQVKQLIAKGNGRGSVGKVLNAAENSESVILVKSNIAPKGEVIGQLWIGLDGGLLDAAQAGIVAQFDTMVSNSQEAVTWVMDQQTKQLTQDYSSAMGHMVKQANAANLEVMQKMEGKSSELSSALVTSSLLSTLALFLLTMAIIGIRIILQIKRLNRAVWDLTEGEADLRRRLQMPGKDELAHMAEGFNRFLERLQGLMEHIKRASGETHRQLTQQIAAGSETARALQTQKEEVEQVSSAIHEMSLSVQEVTQNIQQTADEVRQASDETAKTAQLSSATRQLLEQMVSEIRQASDVINRMHGHSQDIGSVLTVIRSIAEQTNLLALNAAIEAARAGESGRGFAVVADEVRTLASRTQQSTEEIQDIIDRLQRGSVNAVEVMQKASGQVDDSMGSFSRADEQFELLNSLMSRLQARATEISSASAQQSLVANEVSENVNRIASAAEETAHAAARSDEASQKISTQVKFLEGQLEQFKV
ncbi:MAG: methyl-accepting chemotaxis protein [Oleiphilus sp.]|nr:MAG: methyl-accepting chemotaxis protein [Oleiphilus sp.]